MSDKMKCYVCYNDYLSEGCSEPEKVFWYKKDAEAWMKEQNPWFACYKIIEIE